MTSEIGERVSFRSADGKEPENVNFDKIRDIIFTPPTYPHPQSHKVTNPSIYSPELNSDSFG